MADQRVCQLRTTDTNVLDVTRHSLPGRHAFRFRNWELHILHPNAYATIVSRTSFRRPAKTWKKSKPFRRVARISHANPPQEWVPQVSRLRPGKANAPHPSTSA